MAHTQYAHIWKYPPPPLFTTCNIHSGPSEFIRISLELLVKFTHSRQRRASRDLYSWFDGGYVLGVGVEDVLLAELQGDEEADQREEHRDPSSSTARGSVLARTGAGGTRSARGARAAARADGSESAARWGWCAARRWQRREDWWTWCSPVRQARWYTSGSSIAVNCRIWRRTASTLCSSPRSVENKSRLSWTVKDSALRFSKWDQSKMRAGMKR